MFRRVKQLPSATGLSYHLWKLNKNRFIPYAAGLTAILLSAVAPSAETFKLSVASIMRGPQLVGYEPSQVRWSGDGKQIYFQWKQYSDPHEKDMDTWVANPDGSGLRKLTDDETKLAPPTSGDVAPDKSQTVYTRDGDIFVYNHASGKTAQITKTTEAESNPRFTKDGNRISFTRANNLYVMSLDGGSIVQLTDIRAGGAAPAAAPTGFGGGRGGGGGRTASTAADDTPKGTPSQEFLKKQERELLDIIKEKAAKREEAEAKRKKEATRKPLTLSATQTVFSLQLSPDEKYVIASISETAPGGKNSIVPNFVTESAYTEDIPSRNMVGDTQSRSRLAVIHAESGEVKYVDAGIKTKAEPPADRPVRLTNPIWSEDGTKAVLTARAEDNKDRWILALDPATGKTRILATDHDDAWIGGPAQFGSASIGWLKGDKEVYFDSERTGYSHLYAVPYEGGEPRALTSGKWEVLDVKMSKDKSKFYLQTNEVSPAEHQVYVMPSAGGPRTRLTAQAGSHQIWLNPEETAFVDLQSYMTRPPDLFVQEAKPGEAQKRITTSPSPEFAQYPWLDAPIIKFKARDGVEVPAKLFKPAKFAKGGPAVVFVHGAGYAQNVHKYWSSNYYREYMFHHILMERGFTVIDVDYRGSAGYGRDWRTAIYDHMGGKDLDDAVDAAKYVVAEHGVNPKKIGIYGGSYGGFLTLMGMFTASDTFSAGAALRPVTDWSHYNHGYTSNILNNPQSDPEAYRRSSPIYFAQGLKGALLICHGMVDTNVHFQDSVRLIQRLIELGKTNWSVAPYPVEDHGFVEPTSWTDEYSRILDLFEKNLK